MGRWTYVHADQVLPARLVKEISQYATGLIYVPTKAARSREWTAIRVRALKEQGLRNCDIARTLGISQRHVCGVLRRFRESNAAVTETTPAGRTGADGLQ